MLWQRSIALLLWGLVGVAKTIALALLLTAPDTHWRLALLALAIAFALAGAALWWRSRVLSG